MIQTRIIEVLDSKGETGDKDAKASMDDLFSMNDGAVLPDLLSAVLSLHTGSLFEDSEDAHDSVHLSIFSPPPNEV